MRALRGAKKPLLELALKSFHSAQGKSTTLATDFADLLGDSGPSDETADQMIEAMREWRDTLAK